MNRPEPAPSILLDCALHAARLAGEHALANVHRRTEVLQAFKHDVKLNLDVECQRKAAGAILERFPDHAILGEEDTGDQPAAASDYEWIIDPIDGTVNFSHGFPFWCCSIAVRRGGTVLAGAVHAPAIRETYTATLDGPALCNGQPLAVSATPALDQAIVFTGLDKNAAPNVAPNAIFERITARVQRTRVIGSAALDLCMVAAGRGDGYFESGIYIWDIAAAGLIVRRAGGATAGYNRQPGGHRQAFIATNGRLQEELTALIGEALRLDPIA